MQELALVSKKAIAVFLFCTLLITGLFVGFPSPVLAEDTIVINNDCRFTNQPNCGNVTKNDPSLAQATGYLVGITGDIVAISSLGSVAGLSGAGITSGLAAIGSVVGGGMVAGVVITVAAPAAVAIAAGAGVYYLSHKNEAVANAPREQLELQSASIN